MELILNPYVRNLADKFLTPLLKENGCGNLEPQLKTWWFNHAKTPNTGDWSRLTNYNVEGMLGSQERTTLPINGRLKLSEGKISLELLMKFTKLRIIDDTEMEHIRKTYGTQHTKIMNKLNPEGTKDMGNTYMAEFTPEMVMMEATTNPTQEAYYSCILEIGTCTRTVLTNRAQKIIIELGVNIQDLRFTMANNKFKLIKNNRGKLTYIPEEHYTPMVKRIAKRNKEVKINGGSTRVGTYPDPREIYNNTELESAHANTLARRETP